MSTTNQTVVFKGYTIQIIRSKRRSLALELARTGDVLLRIPNFCTDKVISQFLESNIAFLEKVSGKSERIKQLGTRRGEAGESFWFLGDVFILKIHPSFKKTQFDRGSKSIQFKLSGVTAVQAIKKLYKQNATLTLHEILRSTSEQTGLISTKFSLSSARLKWGSCSRAGEIKLNWRLVCAPLEVIRYVCIHELAHLKHFDHSARFWNLVQKFDPDFKTHRKWLKDRNYILNWF